MVEISSILSTRCCGLFSNFDLFDFVSEKKKEKKEATPVPQTGVYIFPNGDQYGEYSSTESSNYRQYIAN